VRDDDRLENAVFIAGLLAAASAVLWGAWYLQGGEIKPTERSPYVAPWQGFSAEITTTVVPTTLPELQTPTTTALTGKNVKPTATPVISVPVSFAPVEEVSAGRAHACQVTHGKVFCAGANLHSALGDMNTDGSVKLPGRATQVAAGQDTSCALVSGVPYCWGWRSQLGAQTGGTPRAMGVTGADKLYAGDGGTICALDLTSGGLDQTGSDDAGVLYCWGESISAAGLTGRDWADEPVKLAESADWDDVAISGRTICTLNGEVTLTCYGDLPGGGHSDTGTIIDTNKAFRHIIITTQGIGNVSVCATREDNSNVKCF
jgi:hypothetical protein